MIEARGHGAILVLRLQAMSAVCRRGGGVALCHEELARTATNYNSSLVAGLLDCVQEGERSRVEESQRSYRNAPFTYAVRWG